MEKREFIAGFFNINITLFDGWPPLLAPGHPAAGKNKNPKIHKDIIH